MRLYQETPPYDGHRRTILKPHHTHVGFGLAVDNLTLRLVELFVAKSRVLWPKLSPRFVYADNGAGVVKVEMDGSFSTLVSLYRGKQGIYTIVTWIKRHDGGKAFPATEVCVRAE